MPVQYLGQLQPTMAQQIALQKALLALQRDNEAAMSRTGQQPTAAGASMGGSAGAGGLSYADKVAEQHRWAAEQEREEKQFKEQLEHEKALKQMDIDSRLAEAMSKERIAGVGAEAGIEQTRIGTAGELAASQKTTMEKGYEFVDVLMKMDEKTANGLISSLEAKRAEGRGEGGPVSTISMGDITKELPRGTPEADPNDPLTWLEEVGAYTPGGGAPRPKPTGTGKNEVEEFYGMVDDMIGGDIAGMAAMLSGEGGIERLLEKIDVIGAKAGVSQEVIDSVKDIYRAMAGTSMPSAGAGVSPKEGEPFWGIPKAIGTTAGNVAPFIHEAVHPEERGIEEQGLARQWEEAAGKQKEPSEFATNLAEFMETVVMGPFYPAYQKKVSEKAGKPVAGEPVPAKKVGEITEQDVITDMSTWSKEKLKEFQTLAKERGLYKGPINGLHSSELEETMRKYFKEYRSEWGEVE